MGRGFNTPTLELHDQEETKIELETLAKVQPGLEISMTAVFAVYFGAFCGFLLHKAMGAQEVYIGKLEFSMGERKT